MRHISRIWLLPILFTLTSIASACGGPTTPSQVAGRPATSETAPTPAPPAVPGTLTFVSASPAPGSDVVVSSPSSGALVAMTFGIRSQAAIPDAVLEVQLLDTAGQPCASGVADTKAMPAGESVTAVVNITLTCTVPMATETVKATLVTVTGASDDKPQRTEYLVASFPDRYTFRAPGPSTPPAQPAPVPPPPPAPPQASGITFVSSDPPPSGETSATGGAGSLQLGNLTMTFVVESPLALPDALLQVQLLNDTGQVCWVTFVEQPMPAHQPVTVPVHGIRLFMEANCPTFPMRTTSVKAMLITIREPSNRTEYIAQVFPISYTIQRYPPPPPGPPPAPPVITTLYWKGYLPTGGAPPLPGDLVGFYCRATEADGAAVVVTLTVVWDGKAPIAKSTAFPVGASSSAEGAIVFYDLGTPQMVQVHATVSCVATNARGETASRSIDLGPPQR